MRLIFAFIMTELTSPAPASWLRRPAARAAAAAIIVLVLVVAASAAWDPSGLLAPVGGRGLPLLDTGGAYQWAPLLVGLPVLLAATALPLLLLAGDRPRRSAWWVFLVTWATVLGAGALATAATGLVTAAPLVGPHLTAGAALRFAFAVSGFAAIKFLLVGPLVAAPAALAFRLSPPPTTTATATANFGETAGEQAGIRAVSPKAVDDTALDDTALDDTAPADVAAGLPETGGGRQAVVGSGIGLAVVGMFVLVTVVAAVFGERWWRGGPVGYAFAGPLLAPTAAAGVVGFVCGTAVFLGIFGMTLQALRRRPAHSTLPAVAVTVWLAATVAGLGLGVLGAVTAALAPRPSDGGPDSWWIATTLLSVATGIGYGVTTGLIGALGAAAAWRWRAALVAAGRFPRLRVAAVPAVAVLVALPLLVASPGVPGPQPVTPVPASGGLERLHLLPASGEGTLPVIGDVTGRQVILRGVNVNQLIDYHLRDPAIPATAPLTDADFADISALGFNVVRLGMSWSRLEPRRGEFDQGYLGQIRAAVASAKAHGVYVVLDMHQDAWGNALARPDEQCGGGTTPTTGWDGAPAWATITDGTLHCQFLARDLAPAVATAYTSFYTDRDGIQTELVRAWAFVAQAFANEPAVAGYDLLNEPGIGANPPISSGLLLGRYYDAAITAIRAAERAGQGFPHLVFFEPSVLWSGLAFDVTPPPGFTDDRLLVFAPHPYSESISMDQGFGLTIATIERNLTVSSRAAAAYGAALWPGEWGWFGDPAVDGAKVARFGAAQDRRGLGGAFWVWKQGCGSPETGPDAKTSGNLAKVDCVTGAPIAPPDGFARPLTRAYPKAFPGRLDTLAAADGGLTFGATAAADGASCRLDIWVPGDAQPVLKTENVSDAATLRVPGGWQVTGCARGTYTVAVTR
ncbi:hypothetical protein CS0771_61510 [Catellatospora sp. IY07-71]|uniref:glycoside hydrolase family 5 protein n=1 Tax=Catellatospora sp. IY07-71 TaxID=2728827 RepID=UPI001BB3C4E4|nr:cellulase family glycosylhydrolase [Catellatospora sp. IY07-71]BCJ76607.1 hypothetical protein CS0771_61510 [Catellatospora sp. IY07-71]